jgi:hypothetical protein
MQTVCKKYKSGKDTTFLVPIVPMEMRTVTARHTPQSRRCGGAHNEICATI